MKETKTITEVYNETVNLIDDSVKYLPFCTGISLQEKSISELSKLIPWIKGVKNNYAENGDETMAKNYLYLQSSVYALLISRKLSTVNLLQNADSMQNIRYFII
nr:hypothetical protein [Leptospira interrogans]